MHVKTLWQRYTAYWLYRAMQKNAALESQFDTWLAETHPSKRQEIDVAIHQDIWSKDVTDILIAKYLIEYVNVILWKRLTSEIISRSVTKKSLERILVMPASQLYEVTTDDEVWGFADYVCANDADKKLERLLESIPARSKIPHLRFASAVGERIAKSLNAHEKGVHQLRTTVTDELTVRF